MKLEDCPKILKTCQDIDIPIKDVWKFVLRHEIYQYGLVIDVLVKKDLVSFYSSYHEEKDKYGMVKRKYNRQSFRIRGKDMPKFRNKLRKELVKQEIKTITKGENPGTPIARSRTINYKEIIINK